MILGSYIFKCRLKNAALLPRYKGSTFRGLFGHALKKVTCTLKFKNCTNCLLIDRCVYARIFEKNLLSTANSKPKRVSAPPHPYVIEPPLTTRTNFQSGEIFDFSIILMGNANYELPYIIYAIKYMGDLGIGKKQDGKRARFNLEEISSKGQIVYDAETDQLTPPEVDELKSQDAPDMQSPVTKLKICFDTPVRLKFRNSFSNELPFHILVRAGLRRISSLEEYYGNGEPDLNYRELISKSQEVEISASGLQWSDWKRYSARQDQKMFLGGLKGSVTYSGDLTQFMGILRYCEKVHIGKQTSFGLGKFRILSVKGLEE